MDLCQILMPGCVSQSHFHIQHPPMQFYYLKVTNIIQSSIKPLKEVPHPENVSLENSFSP